MKVYQQVTGYEQSILNLDILIENTSLGFSVAGGTGQVVGDTTGLLNSGFAFSGYEGYIFDQSGRFVGGYSQNLPINLSIHTKKDNTFSYFLQGDLIANNMGGVTGFDHIEFEKNGNASLVIEYIFD